jgi:VWFA-related protein
MPVRLPPIAARLAGVVCCALGLLVAAPAATPQQTPPVFRTGTILVPIDVRVLDKKGKPVTDLTAADFTVTEDNVRQEIRHFSTQSLVAEEPPAPGTRPTARKVLAADVPPQNQRTFLIVLGRGRLQAPAKGVDGVIHLVRDRLLPQDRVAVLAYNRATDFTTDHDQVLQVLERFKQGHEMVEADLRLMMSGLAAVYGSKDIPPELQGEIDAIFHGPNTPAVRSVMPATIADATAQATRDATDALQRRDTVGARAPGASVPDTNSLADLLGSDVSFDQYVEDAAQTMQQLSTLYAGIAYLRHIEGEKHLIFVSEHGLFLPRAEDDKSLASVASDARVTLDVIYSGGVRMTSGPNWAAATGERIAELTGGYFSGFSMADKAIDQIDRETRFSYLLGYYPANAAWDGKYRRINVKVNRGGLTVEFRHGYFAQADVAPIDLKETRTYSRIAAAGGYGPAIRDIGLHVQATAAKSAAGKREVQVNVIIDAARLALEVIGDRHVGALDISIFCGNASGTVVGESWQKLDLKLLEPTYQRFLADGVHHSVRIPVKNAADYVKVVVYDYGADLLGTAIVRVR